MARRELLAQISLAALALGGGAVIAALSMAYEQPYRDALLAFGILSGTVGFGGLAWLFAFPPKAELPPVALSSPPVEAEKAEKAEIARHDGELPESVTADYLIGLCKNKTHLESEGAVSRYIGHRLRVSGTIWAASRLGEHIDVSIDLQPPKLFPVAYLVFEQDQERVALMRHGDRLTAIGRLTSVGSTQVKLEDCRLID